MRIAVVTDSTSDIPDELAERFKIKVVHNTLVIEGQSIEDGRGITRREFYERLPSMKSQPSTATASSGTYQELYSELFRQGFEGILSIHVASLLSGILNAVNIAAKAMNQPVRVIDSEQVSMGLGFQVLEAAEAVCSASAGQEQDLDSLTALIGDVRSRVRVIAMLDTLEYVRRSGRVNWAKARLGNMLHMKPFIELRDGKVTSRGEARTHTKGVTRLKQMLDELGPLQRLAILHSNAEVEARQFLEEARVPLPTEPLIVNITTIIGTHIGPGALGFAAVLR
jgi:DegV family protein with EDD domain